VNRSDSSGFTLVELAIVVLIMGMLLAFSVPALQTLTNSNNLKGATQNIAAQMRLAREKAISTGVDQIIHFTPNYPSGTTYDYHIHTGGVVGACWSLPKGVDYYTINVTGGPTLLKDGRSSGSGLIVLQDKRGNRDTVMVQASGLILVN
jgi:prepilin-type N-terminal cleavage/methylation domain-containing protein